MSSLQLPRISIIVAISASPRYRGTTTRVEGGINPKWHGDIEGRSLFLTGVAEDTVVLRPGRATVEDRQQIVESQRTGDQVSLHYGISRRNELDGSQEMCRRATNSPSMPHAQDNHRVPTAAETLVTATARRRSRRARRRVPPVLRVTRPNAEEAPHGAPRAAAATAPSKRWRNRSR